MLLIKFKDFWPPVQGGNEYFSGYAYPLDLALQTLSKLHGTQLVDHPDLKNSSDEQDVLNFLEERLLELQLPSPSRVMMAAAGSKAIWSLEDASIQDVLGPVDFSITTIAYRRHVPVGAGLIFWIAMAVAVFFIARG